MSKYAFSPLISFLVNLSFTVILSLVKSSESFWHRSCITYPYKDKLPVECNGHD
jgi:hypothetical protein